jgi:arylsulfatase A-like enzyme
MSHTEFGRWLLQEIKHLEDWSSASVALVDWLELMRKEIDFIEHSITGWIDEVDDFRYPVAQYKASISYFDHLVGLFISDLKRRNLYDQSIIIVTSPHGEIMSYDDIAFHHHIPHPHVFEIPLIWKSSHSAHKGRVQGIMSLTDVYPTLARWLKSDVPLPAMAGRDLHLELEKRQTPVNWTLGFDMKDVTRTLIRPPYFYVVAHKDCKLTGSWVAKKNDAFLFKRTDNIRGMQAVFDQSLTMEFKQDYDKIMEDPDNWNETV